MNICVITSRHKASLLGLVVWNYRIEHYETITRFLLALSLCTHQHVAPLQEAALTAVYDDLEKVKLRDEELCKFSDSELVRIRSKVKSVYIHLMTLSNKERQRIDRPKKSIGVSRDLERKKDNDKKSAFERLGRVSRQVAAEVDYRLANLNPTMDKMQGAVGTLSYTD